jgi:hypothetical protein
MKTISLVSNLVIQRSARVLHIIDERKCCVWQDFPDWLVRVNPSRFGIFFFCILLLPLLIAAATLMLGAGRVDFYADATRGRY